jgi:predicted metal-binding protein
MITEEEYDRAQALLGRKGKPRPKKHIFAFTGLMKCGSCGASITAEEKFKKQKNGNVHHYIYYHCTKRVNPDCPERCIELKELARQIDNVLTRISISERFKEWALKYLHEIRKDEAKATEDILALKQKRYENIVKQLDNLLLKYTAPENADGSIMTDKDYTGLRTRLLKEKNELEAELNATGRQIEDWVELTEKTFNFARYARIWFAKGDLQTKRTIFACLGSDFILKDGKLALTLRKPFNFIFENLSQAEKELVRLEPLNFGSNKKQMAVLTAKCPIILRR